MPMKQPTKEQSSILLCDECGKQRVFVSKGAVCPDGHGRIHPTNRRELKKARLAVERWKQFIALPVAMLVSGKPKRYRIDGQNELYRRAKKDEMECAARISDYKRIYLTTKPEPAKVVA